MLHNVSYLSVVKQIIRKRNIEKQVKENKIGWACSSDVGNIEFYVEPS
jgi:hypothetical protein